MSDLYLELRTRIPVVTSWVQVGSVRLQEAQDATGLSNERLAREIPVSAKTWERWKKRGEVPADSLPAVARALRIEVRRSAPTVLLDDAGSANGSPRSPLGSDDEAATRHQEVIGRLDAIEAQLRQLALIAERR